MRATALIFSVTALGLYSQVCAGENRTIDGTYNNLSEGYEDMGAAGTTLNRYATSGYPDDGTTMAGSSRPGAREISNAIFTQTELIPDERGLSAFVWQWGQFVDHDIDLTPEGSLETAPIPVPSGDIYFDPAGTGTATIDFHRSVYDDADGSRDQMNVISHWIDGSNVYGSDAERASWLRSYEDGKLKVTEHASGDLLPFNDGTQGNAGGQGTNLFVAGDVRANEQVGLTSMHTLFVREHNRRAGELAVMFPDWNDEELYQFSRKLVNAELQAITYNEFLPALLGENALSPYTGYNPDVSAVDPSIMNAFSTAAFRLGHSMLQPTLLRLDSHGNEIAEGNLSLSEAFFNPSRITDEGGIDPVLRGLAAVVQQKTDAKIVDDVRNFLFGPPGAGGLDLASLNIQRGRDHGLPDYNTLRADFGLSPVAGFLDITSDADLAAALAAIYPDVDSIDPWVGMLAEDHVWGASVGETMHKILALQFESLRDGDRFWYQNDPELYAWLSEIEQTRLSDIIVWNTGITSIQDDVFYAVAPTTAVPEPAGMTLMGIGIAGLLLRRRRRPM